MATVANLKAKLVMDIGGFEQAADRAVGKARTMGKSVEDALKKAGKQWRDSIGKGVMALVGVQMADTLLKTIDERMKDPMFENIGKNLAYAVGEGFQKSLESVPVAGTIGSWLGSAIGQATDSLGLTSDASGDQERAQQASRQVADARQNAIIAISSITQQLERQQQLTAAVNEEDRVRLERQFKLADLLQRVNEAGKKGNLSPDQIRAQAEGVRQSFAALSAAEDELKRQEQERLANQQFWTAELEAAEEIMSEIEATWEYIADLGDLTSEAQEKAAAEAEKRAKANAEEAESAARRALEFANVETIGTAIGGVKVAGMTDGSLSRLVPVQERSNSYLKAIMENTKPAAGGAP